MATSLELQFIDESYQKLVQISGSYIADGTGSQINNLNLTASFANNATSASYSNNSTSASYAVSSSHSANSDNAISSSYAVSASHAVNSDIAISASHALNSDNAVSASYSQNAGAAVSASHALNADNSISSSHAISASFAVTASHLIGTITSASYAVSASHANYANSAGTAVSSSHAINSDNSISASHALNSNNSISSSYAITASHLLGAVTSASYAISSSHSEFADNATSSSYAVSSSYAIAANSANTATSASHALLADNLVPGDITHNGVFQQTFAAPSSNSQKTFKNATGVTFNGNSYPISEFSYVNYPLGDQFVNAYNIAQYDGFGYTGGAELLIAPQRVQFNITPKGAAAPGVYNLSGVMAMQSSSLGNGSQVLVYGTEVQLGSFRGVTIALGNRSGIASNQTENLNINAVTSSTVTDYNYNTAQVGHFTTGGSRGNVTAISNGGGGGTTLSLNGGNFYTLDLTANSTTLNINAFDIVASYGQTFSILVDNSSTTNTLAFSSDFKFAGGAAPTITQNGTDILTGIVFGATNVYITAVQNLS